MLGGHHMVGRERHPGVAAFRKRDRAFYLDANGNGVWDGCGTDRCLQMGLSGDTPVVARW